MIRQFLCITTVVLSCSILTTTYAAPRQINEAQTEKSTTKQSHKADFALFVRLMEQVDMQKMTTMIVEDAETATVEQTAQVADVIKNLQALSQSLDQASFATPEGKKVRAAFIAYKDDSIYLLKNQKQWENDEKQKEKLIKHSEQLNQTLVESIQKLKVFAE
ncbi:MULTISPECIES: hypothetical protein [unclassified Acinetobacter]|uniref:hypothetical protein n=1 Tax=unclassified Acinetobacter TaxID=196816 RepID=UPI002577605A|nr:MULTISPECIES: hypothetical protein [unclassified Acinetobacter]MDM1764740.1 hypothetical protein [Acinetobacter sp. 226-1]MDM1769490.1 hypothetical protein [Acinetobacter sp. 226-4]